jgi:hypothetical protein
MSDKLLFIGQSPAHRAHPTALMPLQNQFGEIRYAQIMGISAIRFMELADATHVFDVYPGRPRGSRGGDYFDLQTARENARLIDIHDRRVIFMGYKVASAFGHPRATYFTALPDRRARMAWCLPHPSMRNQWLNDPDHLDQLRHFLRALLGV